MRRGQSFDYSFLVDIRLETRKLVVVVSSLVERDRKLRDDLAPHLVVWERSGAFDLWHEGKLSAGNPRARLAERVAHASCVVVLMSADLLADQERMGLVETALRRGAHVVPVLCRACGWRLSALGELQALPTSGTPIAALQDADAGWDEVATALAERFEAQNGGKAWVTVGFGEQAIHDTSPARRDDSVPSSGPHQSFEAAALPVASASVRASAPWQHAPWDRTDQLVNCEALGVGLRMRWIPPGAFLMGSPPGETGRRENEGPRHSVNLTHGYWLADTPCTQTLWLAVMGGNPSHFAEPEHPVENVSWDECQIFLHRLRIAVPYIHWRLPTEAEWEYACRGGTAGATWVGDLDLRRQRVPTLDEIAWYGANAGGRTHPVGMKGANPFGLFDMLGNVCEWCSDWLGEHSALPTTDPTGSLKGTFRVCRGGAWSSVAGDVRAAFRDGFSASDRHVHLGFRLAADLAT